MNLTNRLIRKLKNESIPRAFADAYTYFYELYYDKKYHLDTYGWVTNEDLDVSADTKKDSSMYMASKAYHVRKVFKSLNLLKNKVIVDIGSGKGRALLMATEFGFKEARGVEFSPNLCKITQENIENYTARRKTNTVFKVYNEDARSYQFQDDEYVFFISNPFNAISLSKVIDHIQDSLKRNPREALLIYANAASKQKLVEERFNYKNRREFKVFSGHYLAYDI